MGCYVFEWLFMNVGSFVYGFYAMVAMRLQVHRHVRINVTQRRSQRHKRMDIMSESTS